MITMDSSVTSFCTDDADSVTVASLSTSRSSIWSSVDSSSGGSSNESPTTNWGGNCSTSSLVLLGNRLRVRVVNQTTERYKDILLEPADNVFLYEAVYDNQAIKEAHVRKWGSTIAQQCKKGLLEIQCVLVGERNSGTTTTTLTLSGGGGGGAHYTAGRSCHVFSLSDLKTTTTQQLAEMVAAMEPPTQNTASSSSSNRVRLLLRAVKTKSSVPTTTPTATKQQQQLLQQQRLGRLRFTSQPELTTTLASSSCRKKRSSTSDSNLMAPPMRRGGAGGRTSYLASFQASKMRNATFSSSLGGGGGLWPSQKRSKNNENNSNMNLNNHNTGDRFRRFLNSDTPSIVEVPFEHTSHASSDSCSVGGCASTSTTGGAVGDDDDAMSGVCLPPEVVKEVFPYHIVFDENFCILQVGNKLSKLIGAGGAGSAGMDNNNNNNDEFLERSVYDILKFTGPIPQEGIWDWSVLDSMMDKTVFLEPVEDNSSAKIKGTLIHVSGSSSSLSSSSPLVERRQVMLALFPDVKNLTELSNMNLTMADLPIHSCQRDAVLVGEHSASEVKLTSHLDQRHRDLINSMEKQIEDRTRELAGANCDLEQANAKLAQHSARQLEHFACMSHEIRTPLNCIVGMTSLMMDTQQGMSPAHVEAVNMINGSGELLRAVVDDVLDFAKLESGSFETVVRRTHLQETLDIVVHSIAQKIRAKHITLRTQYSANLPKTLETDKRRLQQVLYNLLGNAGKFSKTGSSIDLTVSLIPSSSSSLEDSNGDKSPNQCDMIRFSVKDYGKGIRREDFKKIFQPFSQASKETQHLYGGTGLGLSITSKLVERLGGTISVDSEEGVFAEFTVDLPFRGEPVNVDSLKQQLSNTSIVFVEPEMTKSSSDEESVLESSPFRPDVVSEYNLNVHTFTTCDNLAHKLAAATPLAAGQHKTLLVHEDLYDAQALERFETAVGSANCTVITYGPTYKVPATNKDRRHFKSVSRMIPSILLETVASHIAEDKKQKDLRVSRAQKESAAGSGGDANKSSTKNDPLEGSSTSLTNTTSSAGNAALQLPTRRDLKVLYAEDTPINQKVLKRILKHVGVEKVDIVGNGQEAVDISARNTYDLIFMDMQMPVMDGLDATRLIMERDKEAVVIFVTAHALDEYKSQAYAAGGKGFISKPFRASDIAQALELFGCVA